MPHSQLAHQQAAQEFGLEWQLVLKHGVLAPDGKGNGGRALNVLNPLGQVLWKTGPFDSIE